MSIRKRKWKPKNRPPQEKWVVDYKDLQGVRRLKTFDRKKEADDHWGKVREELKQGTHVAEAETITVAKACENWLTECEQLGLEQSTTDAYKTHVDLHIVPFIGTLLLTKISVPVIRNWQKRLLEGGRSPNLVKRLQVDLGALLGCAQDSGYVARNAVREMNSRLKNKAKKVETRHKRKLGIGIDIPMPTEIQLIQEHTDPKFRPLMMTAIFTGLRSSELRGLPWSSVDFDEHKIHVVQRIDRYSVIGAPKSNSSKRAIPVPPIVMNTLKTWKAECPDGPHKLVFPNGEGNPENHANVVKRVLGPAQFAAGLTALRPKHDKNKKVVLGEDGKPLMVLGPKYPGLHCLRHFFASWCINRRRNGGLELIAKEVQYRMGHESIKVTMDTYGHLFPAQDETESLAEAARHLLPALRAT